jgi:hypothetical protein
MSLQVLTNLRILKESVLTKLMKNQGKSSAKDTLTDTLS